MKHIIYTILIFSAVQLSAQNYSGGLGTEVNPFMINDISDLIYLSLHSNDWDKHFIQIADIDAQKTSIINYGDHDNDPASPDQAMGISPIGNTLYAFTGTYNGDGYAILNLNINRPQLENTGLFGYTSFATISNINLIDCSVSGGKSTGSLVGKNSAGQVINCSATAIVNGNGYNVGGLVGFNFCNASIINSNAKGFVTNNNYKTGGLVGSNHYSSTIENSYLLCNVHGLSLTGGISGNNDYNSKIKNSYSSGEIIGSSTIGGLTGENNSSQIYNSYSTCIVSGSFTRCGGLVGYSNYSGYKTEIVNSYATGSVSGTSEIGGFIGKNNKGQIKNSYSTGAVTGTSYIGGFIGYNTGVTANVTNSFYDNETSGIENLAIAVDENNQNVCAIPTHQFKNVATFQDLWQIIPVADYNNPWVINFDGRPYLYFQQVAISNAVCQGNDDNEFLSIGDLLNIDGIVITEIGYRFKAKNSIIWIEKPIENKNTLLKQYFSSIEINPNNDYYVQAYVKDINNNYYYGDAAVKNNYIPTLPVELVSFSTFSGEYYTELEWKTSAEINNDYFTIEISNDAYNWSVVKHIEGNGNCNYENNYKLLTDKENTVVYYRLSQTDFDGTHEILRTIALEPSIQNNVEISIYPNPASDYIVINNCPIGKVSIYNTSGQIVLEDNIDEYRNTINISGLIPGNYFVKFQNTETKISTISIVR
ncbi:MAG: T9SS type A sorting domain-containing protein [Bacteroidales bacterium]|nr:T9SS type A sorting domain-containing protein [Bacteroidales bacterium]